jgi:uncharacterized protein YjiS (DUF1127 family)
MHTLSIQMVDEIAMQASSKVLHMVRAFQRWWLECRTRAALAALDDAALKDIGLYRCAIPWAARMAHAEPGSMMT